MTPVEAWSRPRLCIDRLPLRPDRPVLRGGRPGPAGITGRGRGPDHLPDSTQGRARAHAGAVRRWSDPGLPGHRGVWGGTFCAVSIMPVWISLPRARPENARCFLTGKLCANHERRAQGLRRVVRRRISSSGLAVRRKRGGRVLDPDTLRPTVGGLRPSGSPTKAAVPDEPTAGMAS